jgi:hypothetical protein
MNSRNFSSVFIDQCEINQLVRSEVERALHEVSEFDMKQLVAAARRERNGRRTEARLEQKNQRNNRAADDGA